MKKVSRFVATAVTVALIGSTLSSIPATACTKVIPDTSDSTNIYDGKYDGYSIITYSDGKIYVNYKLSDISGSEVETYGSSHLGYLIKTSDNIDALAESEDSYLYSLNGEEWINSQDTVEFRMTTNNIYEYIERLEIEDLTENLYFYVNKGTDLMTAKEIENEANELYKTYNIDEITDVDIASSSPGQYMDTINVGIPEDMEMTDELKEEIISRMPEYSLGWNIDDTYKEMYFDDFGTVKVYTLWYVDDSEKTVDEDGAVCYVHTASDCICEYFFGSTTLEFANSLYDIDEVVYSVPHVEFYALEYTSVVTTKLSDSKPVDDITKEVEPTEDLTEISTETATKAQETKTIVLGDINGDDKVDSIDAVFTLKDFASQILGNKSTLDLSVADMNDDGKINSSDAVIILKTYADNLISK
jgi:hypothetical protein